MRAQVFVGASSARYARVVAAPAPLRENSSPRPVRRGLPRDRRPQCATGAALGRRPSSRPGRRAMRPRRPRSPPRSRCSGTRSRATAPPRWNSRRPPPRLRRARERASGQPRSHEATNVPSSSAARAGDESDRQIGEDEPGAHQRGVAPGAGRSKSWARRPGAAPRWRTPALDPPSAGARYAGALLAHRPGRGRRRRTEWRSRSSGAAQPGQGRRAPHPRAGGGELAIRMKWDVLAAGLLEHSRRPR